MAIALTITNSVDLCLREIVESPISLVNRDPEGPAMTPVMVLSELCNGNDLLVIPDNIEQPGI
jgi:hypothetical protein